MKNLKMLRTYELPEGKGTRLMDSVYPFPDEEADRLISEGVGQLVRDVPPAQKKETPKPKSKKGDSVRTPKRKKK